MNALEKVDFFGDSIWAGREGDTVIVAVKPMVEALGLDWSSQLHRIKRDSVLSEGMVVTTIPSPGGPQDSVALPLNLIPGFLFGISDERITDPEVRARVLAYKRECYAVLYRHFFGPRVSPDDETAELTILDKIRIVREIRLTSGRRAAQSWLRHLGLEIADPVERGGTPTQGLDFVRQFLADRTAEAPGGRVQAAELKRAYDLWAAEAGAPAMTMSGFGRSLTALGLQKTQSSMIYYVGIRIRHVAEITG